MKDSELKIKKYSENDQYNLKIQIWIFLLSFMPLIIILLMLFAILYMHYYDVGFLDFSSSKSIIFTSIVPLLWIFMMYKKTNNKTKTKISLNRDNKQSIYLYRKIAIMRKKAILHRKNKA